MAVLRYTLIAILLGACGLDPFSEGPGGADNLPTAGAGPYARFDSDDSTPADEPFVIFDSQADLTDPSVLAGGPGLRIWMSREVPGPPADDTQIYYVEIASAHDVPKDPPRLALAADQPWEEGRVAAPSVIRTDAGLTMFYEGGVTMHQIGVATSTDDGATWTKAPDPVLADASVPSAAFVTDHYELYVTRTGSPAIWRAIAPGPSAFTFDAAPVMSPRPGLAKAFDADSLTDPDIVIERETTGTLHWTLFAVGHASAPSDAGTGNPAIGAVGSFDGVHWERYGAAAPQLSQPATGPAVLISPAHGLMLYGDAKRGLKCIAAAHNP